MTGSGDDIPLTPRDEDDLLAAEFVLGVLPQDERIAVETRARREPGLAVRIARWEARLAPLNDHYPEVKPPRRVLSRIEARVFASARRGWIGGLSGLLGGATVALVLAVLVALWVMPPPLAPLTARLAGEATALAFEARLDPSSGTLHLVQLAGDAAPSGQDLQLWATGADGVPQSLGLIRDARTVRPQPALPSGVVLAVSLEPAGGSPQPAPTGPILVTGTLRAP